MLEPSFTFTPGLGNISVTTFFSSTSISVSKFDSSFFSSSILVASFIVKFLTSGISTCFFSFSSFYSFVYSFLTPRYSKLWLITSFIIGPSVVEPKATTSVGSSTIANTTICGSSTGATLINEHMYFPWA